MSGKEQAGRPASSRTKAAGPGQPVLPDKLKAAAHRRMAEPGSGEQ